MNYKKLRKQTEKIVKKASKFMISVDFTVTDKDDVVNVVTTADVNVQRYLCEKLSKLLPSAGFYCEEENLKDTQSEYIWVIDPIDGTMNFTRGISDCAISVGLICNKEPVLGVVYLPFKKEMFSSSKGENAMKNGKKISVSDKPFNRSLLYTAMSLYKKELAPICDNIICETYSKCSDYRRLGTCAVELCYIAEGKADLYFEIRVFPWDYAGAYFILLQAGGVLKGFKGETLTFDKATPLIGANNIENYNTLNEIVNKYMDKVPY